MKTLIVANWKMNPQTAKEAKKLFDAVKKGAKNKNTDIVICPPFVYLPLLKGLPLGAQNIFWEEKGAFTGEICAAQLKDLKIKYVIIGHSERRKYFGETNEQINKKIKKALDRDINPIFCIGETLEENRAEKKSEVLERQITEGLHGVSKFEIQNSKLVIAYEPVWAIGTGQNCSVDETLKSMLLIRKIISNRYNRELADDMKMLYGGSVNSKNSAEYIKGGGVSGLLVGGASLDAQEFISIIKSI